MRPCLKMKDGFSVLLVLHSEIHSGSLGATIFKASFLPLFLALKQKRGSTVATPNNTPAGPGCLWGVGGNEPWSPCSRPPLQPSSPSAAQAPGISEACRGPAELRPARVIIRACPPSPGEGERGRPAPAGSRPRSALPRPRLPRPVTAASPRQEQRRSEGPMTAARARGVRTPARAVRVVARPRPAAPRRARSSRPAPGR